MKELEEAREQEKNKWQNFNAKVCIHEPSYSYCIYLIFYILTGSQNQKRRHSKKINLCNARRTGWSGWSWNLWNQWPAHDRLYSARKAQKEMKNNHTSI